MLRVVSVIALAFACTACGTVAAHVLGAGPGTPGDPRIFDDAIRGAQVAGYQPLRIDAEHGRFELVSRVDRSGLTRFAVQCHADGWVTIVPSEGALERRGDEVRVSPGLRNEQGRIAAEIGRAVEVRP